MLRAGPSSSKPLRYKMRSRETNDCNKHPRAASASLRTSVLVGRLHRNRRKDILDFYRLSDPTPDPVMVEKFFSKLESQIAPLLKSLDTELRQPNQDEFDLLLQFMAFQPGRRLRSSVRLPASCLDPVMGERPSVPALLPRPHEMQLAGVYWEQ
jgi:hypothetical protein